MDLSGVRSGHITTLLCPVTQVWDPTAYISYFANASGLCILVQHLSLCFLCIMPSAQSACPELFCKFTVLNSLKSILQTHSFHNTLITSANRTYALIRIEQQTNPLNCTILSTVPCQVAT